MDAITRNNRRTSSFREVYLRIMPTPEIFHGKFKQQLVDAKLVSWGECDRHLMSTVDNMVIRTRTVLSKERN
jgi:hypothetical protein